MLTTACKAAVTTAEAQDLAALTARLEAHGCPCPWECATHTAAKLTEEDQ